MRAALLAIVVAACAPPAPVVEHVAPPAPGLSIAIYEDGDRTVALVDDRRTIQVRDGQVVLDQLDTGASLASLVVAAPGVRGFGVGPCRRVVAGRVRCAVRGAAGPVFVRIVYASSTLGFRARHVIAPRDGHATIETTFELALPAWGRRGTIALYDGVPGGARAPVRLGAIERALDGTTAALHVPAREVDAQRIVVFDPLRQKLVDGDDAQRGLPAWEWLELAHTALPPGDIEIREDVAGAAPFTTQLHTADTVAVGDALRVPLRRDDAVRGRRERRGEIEHEGVQVDHLRYWLTNDDARAHTVIIEEQLRAGTTPRVVEASPRRPAIEGDVARLELEVPATGTAHAAFTIAYPP